MKWFTLSTIVVPMVNFLCISTVGALVGQSSLGAYFGVLALVHTLAALTSFGADQAVIRHEMDPEVCSIALVTCMLQMFLLFAGAFLLSNVGTLVSEVTGAYWLCASVLLTSIGNLGFSRAIFLGKTDELGVALLLAHLPPNFIVIYCVYTDQFFVDTALLLIIRDASVGFIFFLMSMTNLCSMKFAKFSAFKFRIVTAFCIDLYKLNVLERIVKRLDVLLIGTVQDLAFLGIYGYVKTLCEGGLSVFTKLIQVQLYGYYCRNRKDLAFYNRRSTWIVIFSIICAAMAFPAGAALAGIVKYIFASDDAIQFVCFCLLISAFATIVFEEGKVLLMSESLHASAVPARLIQFLILGVVGYCTLAMFPIEIFTSVLAVSSLIPAVFVHRLVDARRDKIV